MTDRAHRMLKKVACEIRQTSSDTITREFTVLRIVQPAPRLCVESYEEWGSMGEQLPINQIFRG
jgi:hypothetical protein